MTQNRSPHWAATSARVVVGLAVAAGLVVVGVAAIAAPWPQLTREPVTVAATPTPNASVVTCAGPLLVLGRDATQAGGVSVAAAQSVTAGVGPGDPAASSRSLQTPGISAGSSPLTFSAPPSADGPSDLAASGSSQVEAEDLRGLAVSGCRAPMSETWLVGGSTTTGSADLVLLANPGDVPATVRLTVYGARGPQTAPGGAAVVVAPGTQRAVPLAGLLLGEASPVVRVTATGAPVQASLQSSLTRTLIPGGVEQVGPAPGLATSLAIPGVVVPDTVSGTSGLVTSVLRLLSPDADTNAAITISPVGGADISREPVPLPAGVPAQVDISGLAPGTYTVRVEADQPLVGAVWQTTGLGQGSDFSWYAAAPEITGHTVLAVPAGPSPALVVWNPTDAAQTVTLEGSGTPVTVSVPALGSARTPVTAGSVWSLSTTGAIRAAVSYAGAGALSSMTVWPAQAAASTITVAP